MANATAQGHFKSTKNWFFNRCGKINTFLSKYYNNFYHLKLQGVKLNPFVYYLLPLVSVRITQSAENPIKIDEVC